MFVSFTRGPTSDKVQKLHRALLHGYNKRIQQDSTTSDTRNHLNHCNPAITRKTDLRNWSTVRLRKVRTIFFDTPKCGLWRILKLLLLIQSKKPFIVCVPACQHNCYGYKRKNCTFANFTHCPYQTKKSRACECACALIVWLAVRCDTDNKLSNMSWLTSRCRFDAGCCRLVK